MVLSSDAEEPLLFPGQIWRPRGQGLSREILSCETQTGHEQVVHYGTLHGRFSTSASNFRFWISRLSASVEESESCQIHSPTNGT